jgi:hypothetical protein
MEARAVALEGNVADLTSSRTDELQGRGLDAAESLGSLTARLEATAPEAGRRELNKARGLLARAEEGDSLEAAADAIERLEARTTERWADEEERKLLLEELAEKTRVRIVPESVKVRDDGNIEASASVEGQGVSPITITGSRAGGGEGSVILWHVSRSSIRARDGEDDCDAQREAVEAVAEEYGEGMSVRQDGEVETPAEPRSVTRRAR